MIELVYETHSLTTDNECGIATGWLDGELSAAGKRFATELGARRRNDRIAAVFTSDLGRAVQTVEIAFGATAIPVYRDARLRECNYGELNGASIADVDRVRSQHLDVPFAGGESYRQVVDRTRELLADLAHGPDARRLLVIAHSANRWALDHLLNGESLAELVALPFDWREGWLYELPRGWT